MTVNREKGKAQPSQQRSFKPEEIDQGILRLKRRVAEVERLRDSARLLNSQEVRNVDHSIQDTIRDVFGQDSAQHNRYRSYASIAPLPGYDGPLRTGSRSFRDGAQTAIIFLQGLIDGLSEKQEVLRLSHGTSAPEEPALRSGKKVFLVHGRDEAAKQSVARFLEKLELDPIVLHEQPSQGRTVIEKFETYSDVAYAVVLLTSDDRGGLKGDTPDEYKPRARQNVILELGFFLGKLGRNRVCPLYEGGVELPSDYEGVVYVPLDAAGAWKLMLAQEMKAAGLDVDLNKLA